MQPLSSDREEKEGGVTRIDWDLIISVQASERNPKEFTILAVPENKKKLQGIVNKTNAQQMVFTCKERNRLLTEIIHKLHIYNGEKPYLIEKAYHQTDIYKEGSYQIVSFRLHPTVIQVIIKPQESRKKLGGKIAVGSSLKSHRQKKEFSKNTNEESKKIFDESYEESEVSDDNGSLDMFQNQEENEDEDFSEYESESQGMNGTLLTPYKGSMMGGTIIGEESAVPGTVNDQVQVQAYRQHFIYLCEIDRIFTYQKSLIIVKKNQEIDKFIFRSDEKVTEHINMIKKNYKEAYKSNLQTQVIQSFENDKIFDDLEFLIRESKPCFSQQVSVFTWDGLLQGLQIDIDEKYIYEVDRVLNKIRKKCALKDLQMVRITDKNDTYNLVLMFKNEIEMVLMVPTLNEREKLLSSILTLRNFVLPQYGHVDQLIILINSQIDFSQKILGHDPLENAQYIQDYESLLFRKITENISYKDNMKINSLVEESLLNTSFSNLTKIEQKNIKVIFKEINNHLEQYLAFESNEPLIIEASLKKNNDDHLIDFNVYKKKLQTIASNLVNPQQANQSAQVEQVTNENNNIYNEDGVERIKQYEQLLERTSKYLNILNIFLNSKVVLGEIQEHEDLIAQLVKLLISRNPYLSILASQVLKSIIEHFSGLETKNEMINKKTLIKGKLTMSQAQGSNQADQQNAQMFIANDNGENIFFLQALKEYLQYFDYLHETQNVIKSLHFCALTNLLRSILLQRKCSTAKEDLKLFADLIFEDDSNYLNLLHQESLTQPQVENTKNSTYIMIQDPLMNKPMFHLIDRLCLLGDEHFDVQYLCTLLLNESLSLYKKHESDKLQQAQQYILTYSIQFVWHLYLQSESLIREQRTISIHTLSKILYQCQDSILLLLRCIPKTLVDKVETHIDLALSLSWNDQEWEEFFIKITTKNYDTATEQWNDETRAELKKRLQKELKNFKDAQLLHKQVMKDDQRRELVLPNHEFNRAKKVISRCINLKWNYMEFAVKFECLNNKYLVWRYYLTKLLVEQNLQETQRPYFTQLIDKPVLFWQELKIKFMSSFDSQEQIIILKTMCVLYNKHYDQLKDLKTIPYLLKLFDQQQYEHCHFILIQLMHVALSVHRDYSIKNMKKFIKAGGLNTLMQSMKLVYKELIRPDRGKPVESNPQLLVLSTFSREQFEKIVHGEGLLQDKANYTNSNTNSRYFKRNSEFVCVGILSLKILDLIFQEMCAIDYVPLPTNREFLLRPQSLAILSQSLMVENNDLTRELTIFIEKHMNNHYSYFKLKNSGMIEYLILGLASKNGDRDLEILQKFQEVSFDFNNHLKIGLFNSNDLKMLQDDREKIFKNQQQHSEIEKSQSENQADKVIGDQKKFTVLAESIFLRFLPIPFIKFLYEEGQQKFLEIYKMHNYESPILIWNSKLRTILEQSIIEHSSDFVQQLKDYADQPSQELKSSEKMPIYNKKFKNIVRYPDIEGEVRCGRYYLRVWVNQKKKDTNFFDIPPEEEEEFHKNLQIELRHCIYEENFADQQKIIILFKACLQTLHRFSTKKTFSLDEIKRILIDTCKNQPIYNDTVKQMIYIGIKIIYQVVRRESQHFLKNSAKTNADSLKEALTKIGVEIIGEIFTLILKNSFNTEFQSIGSYKLNEEGDQQQNPQIIDKEITDENSRIKLDRIEAKTLSLCIQSFNIILNTDILAFVDFPLASRINLFKQVSRLLDASFTLIPLFKDKQLSNQIHMHDSNTYSSYNNIQQQSPKGKNGKKHGKSKRSKSKRNKSRNPNQGAVNAHQSWQMMNITNNNQSSYNPHLGQILAKPTQNQLIMELDKYNFGKQKEMRDRKKIHKKDASIDYQNNSLLQIINDHMDKHSIELIFDMTRSIFELTREITKNPVLHPELIASGMAWKALKYIYLQLKEQTNEYQDLRASLREATATLKNLISFAHQLANYGAESFVFKNLTKETEKEIMKNFWKCIKSIFGQKIQETLISQFLITNNELHFQAYDSRRFLQQFSVREENSPELVWNDETRKELLNALDKQISNLHDSFYEDLIDFEYSVNKRELRVEDIFVRHFNNQSYYKPPDIENFSSKLIEKLREIIEFKYIADLDKEQYQNCIELVKALKIILINENLIISDQVKFDDYLCTFCNLIQIKPDNQNQYNPSQDEIDMIKGISVLVLEIIQHISKSGGLHFDYLKNNNDFIRLLIRALYSKENEILDSQSIISILQNMLSSKELDINQFLISTGLIMFILNQIFEKKTQNANKKDRVELIKLILQASPYTQGIFSKYIPQFFFVEIQSKQLNDPDTEKIIEFIKELDAPEFENVFIIWNSNLKNESHQRIKNNCEQIARSYEDSNFQVQLDLHELVNPKLEHEIIVSDVIIRIYNKNPAVFINVKLNTFILHLSQEIWKVSQELFKIGQGQLSKDEYDDFLGREPQININSSQKFKALCNQSLILLTSLLLSLEQLLLNDYNSNRLMANKKEDKNAETKFYKQIIEKTTDQTQLDHKVYQIISFWLQTQVFLSRHIPVEIRITFFQIIFMIIDVSDAVKVFKDNQSLMQFITDSISSIAADKFSKTIEEALILLITQKMLRKDSEPTPVLLTNSMLKLFKIYDKKKKLKKLVEFILALMASDQQYKQSVVEYIKQNQAIAKIDTKLIFEGRHENSEHTEAIMRIWRGKPASSSDAKRYYDISECFHIEDKLEETNIPKMKLPIISKKSAQQYQKEEIFYEEEKKHLEVVISNKTIKTGNYDLPFFSTKESKLGYQTILDEVQQIGGNDLEAIEKQDEPQSDDDDQQA